ncbi:MAG: polysaccharide pyruvyl transferase family protein [Kluyvera sp.]|uniref:polysaccharide pyruvyl transferase family protein n=1 Tax=Kluyvera sp. TaxID=1538228 RepID=UPI003A8C5D24
MKVAIMTQPLHTNYGGTLQAYALQKVIVKLGHEPETINYRLNPKKPNILKVFFSKIKQLIVNGKLYYRFSSADIERISKEHLRFIKINIKYSHEINSISDLSSYFKKQAYSAVIVGSDQTWRPIYSPRIESFFLDFLIQNNEILKISYAASFGTDDWEFSEQQTINCGMLLRDFHYVSVREQSAITLCKEKFNVNAVHVLDPTLLLSRDEYFSLLKPYIINENKGKIFSYVLDENIKKNKIIDEVANFFNKDIFFTYPKARRKKTFKIADFSEYEFPSIESWLASFESASFVITDSFHGTVFAIIFNKPFISIANEERGKARFISLLNLFNLDDRLVSKVEDISPELLNSDIDYDVVNMKLAILKEQCMGNLEKALLALGNQ